VLVKKTCPPFRFCGSCRLEPSFDGEVTSEVVQSADGLHDHVLKVCPEVSVDVSCDAEDLDSGDAVFDTHPYPSNAAVGLLLLRGQFVALICCVESDASDSKYKIPSNQWSL